MRLSTLTAILALAAAPALPQTGDAAPDGAGARGMMPAFDFQAADTDGDGALSREEFAAHVEAQVEAARAQRLEARVAAIMEAGDADGDGLLSAEELQTALSALHEQRMERRSEWRERRSEARAERSESREDRAERRKARAEGRGMRGHRGMMRHGMHGGMMRGGDRAQMIERMFDRIDADDDGSISAEEFEAAQARWQERIERRGQRRVD